MAKKLALGRGAASLFGGVPNEALKDNLKELSKQQDETQAMAPAYPENEVVSESAPVIIEEKKIEINEGPLMVAVSEIHPNPGQPRKIFKSKEIEELSISIKENGIIQPLIVAKAEEGFELIAGERRLRASKKAGLEYVPVVVKKATEREKMVMAIIENVQRSDLNPVEEALAYYQLMDVYKLTQEEVSKKLGKERSTIANFLRILKLPREVVDMIQKELLTFGHAKVLASVKDASKILRFANLVITKGLTVRDLEKEIKKERKINGEENGTTNFFDVKLGDLKDKLESNTGFHFALNSKKNGSGQVVIKFNNEAEFNDIYEYLLK